MSIKLRNGGVEILMNRGLFNCAVHSFNLPVGPMTALDFYKIITGSRSQFFFFVQSDREDKACNASNYGDFIFMPGIHNCDLRWADLRGANLEATSLWETDLSGANLIGAQMSDEFREYARSAGAILD